MQIDSSESEPEEPVPPPKKSRTTATKKVEPKPKATRAKKKTATTPPRQPRLTFESQNIPIPSDDDEGGSSAFQSIKSKPKGGGFNPRRR